MVKRYVVDKVCKKCQMRTWLTIFFIEDKYVAHESTSPKTYFIDGCWCRASPLSPDCTSSYTNPTSWMIQGVVVDGKEVLRLIDGKVCKKCQTRTWLKIFFIEDKCIGQESTSQKFTLSMVG